MCVPNHGVPCQVQFARVITATVTSAAAAVSPLGGISQSPVAAAAATAVMWRTNVAFIFHAWRLLRLNANWVEGDNIFPSFEAEWEGGRGGV